MVCIYKICSYELGLRNFTKFTGIGQITLINKILLIGTFIKCLKNIIIIIINPRLLPYAVGYLRQIIRPINFKSIQICLKNLNTYMRSFPSYNSWRLFAVEYCGVMWGEFWVWKLFLWNKEIYKLKNYKHI